MLFLRSPARPARPVIEPVTVGEETVIEQALGKGWVLFKIGLK